MLMFCELLPKRRWVKKGTLFAVELSWHTIDVEVDVVSEGPPGPNRWCMYAYVYPGHWLFEELNPEGGLFQPALGGLPLHRGCTYFKPNVMYGSDDIKSFKFGADYCHFGDDVYGEMDEPCAPLLDDLSTLYEFLGREGHSVDYQEGADR